jgi:hypothetical protein
MPPQFELTGQDCLSLRDAIAYEFYMDNVVTTMEQCKSNDEDYAKALATLARASYIVADIFWAAREQQLNPSSES